jgi:hypothetical protein
MHISLLKWLVAIVLGLLATTPSAQEVLLDQMQEAGGLKLFPVYGNPQSFYYLPDRIVIPNGSTGKPQFSFLKFVIEEAGSGEGGIQDVGGGGLVSFLISFSVDDQTVRNAEAELQSKVSGARIVGPINYREGTFALVSNFQQEDGDWTQRVVGLGKAPVMEDHKAAVSIRLTKLGANILWESFQQAASDIFVSFDMTISGYRNPYEARMVAWWERVARNRSLNIGARTDFLGVDVQDVMKELREAGAIEVEIKGEDEHMDRLWEMAYGKLAEQIFEPSNDPTTLATLQDDPNMYSNFERANQFNTEVRERVARDNQAEIAREEQERQRLLAFADQWPLLGDIARGMEAGPSGGDGPGESAENGEGEVDESSSDGDSTQASGADSVAQGGRPQVRPANLQTPPSFSLLASYRKKEFKKTGKFELNFKKWTTDTQVMRFDENIGGFGKRMLEDPAHFRTINTYDPAYTIREILVQLDGQNSADFGEYVNFVSVSIRKVHQDGFKHYDELKIDRNNFNQNANNFAMKYGWHGDSDREEWLNYEYRVTWNLFGGVEWSTDWQTTDDFIIPVVPPHRYRIVTVEADPEVFDSEQVRLATLKFKYDLFGKENIREVTLRPGGDGVLSQTIKYAHEPTDYDYQYDISWLKRGGVQLKKESVTGDAEYIFADEMPNLE